MLTVQPPDAQVKQRVLLLYDHPSIQQLKLARDSTYTAVNLSLPYRCRDIYQLIFGRKLMIHKAQNSFNNSAEMRTR